MNKCQNIPSPYKWVAGSFPFQDLMVVLSIIGLFMSLLGMMAARL